MRSRPTPLFLESEDGPIFGFLHHPEPELYTGVRAILCPPVGYEGLFAHPALRALAEHLAGLGVAVLRFDPAGTGESCSVAVEENHFDAWLRSAHAALDALDDILGPAGTEVLIGLRAGALVANTVAAERPLDGLVLWAPIESGKAFIREQRALAMVAHQTAAANRHDPRPGFESAGFHFSERTALDLSGRDFHTGEPLGCRVLVVARSDTPRIQSLPYQSATGDADVVETADYASLMQPPRHAKVPEASISAIGRWIDGFQGAATPYEARLDPVTASARLSAHATEHAVWVDGEELFGVLTQPAEREVAHGLVLLNNAMGYRAGPHAMNPSLARGLAGSGIATLRLDVAGVGDSPQPMSRPEHHVYGLDAIGDVKKAVGYLRSRGIDQVTLSGLCSGSYLAWHAAKELDVGIILLNPQTFLWTPDQSLDVSPLETQYRSDHYRRAMRSRTSWWKVLQGRASLRIAMGTMARSLYQNAATSARRVSALAHLRHASEVAREIRRLGSAERPVIFVFSDRDPGLRNLRAELGPQWGLLEASGLMRVEVVEGADHSFTPAWATEALYKILDAGLTEGH